MELLESAGLIVGTIAAAMALPFVMERLERSLDDPSAARERRRIRLRLPHPRRPHLPSIKPVHLQPEHHSSATRP